MAEAYIEGVAQEIVDFFGSNKESLEGLLKWEDKPLLHFAKKMPGYGSYLFMTKEKTLPQDVAVEIRLAIQTRMYASQSQESTPSGYFILYRSDAYHIGTCVRNENKKIVGIRLLSKGSVINLMPGDSLLVVPPDGWMFARDLPDIDDSVKGVEKSRITYRIYLERVLEFRDTYVFGQVTFKGNVLVDAMSQAEAERLAQEQINSNSVEFFQDIHWFDTALAEKLTGIGWKYVEKSLKILNSEKA